MFFFQKIDLSPKQETKDWIQNIGIIYVHPLKYIIYHLGFILHSLKLLPNAPFLPVGSNAVIVYQVTFDSKFMWKEMDFLENYFLLLKYDHEILSGIHVTYS